MKRLFDIFASFAGMIFLSPLLFLVSIGILILDRGPVFYKQIRVGYKGKDFKILKFRTMFVDQKGIGITVGNNDPRVTPIGYYLRKYKIDELPQLWNVFMGDMSLVGPRPELPEYVNLYTPEQLYILSIRPGITDIASIEFRNESELLKSFKDPQQAYLNEIMPKKLSLNLKYIENQSFLLDLKLILRTIFPK